MFLKPDVTFKNVDPPVDMYCQNGHVAPEFFRRSNSEDTPMKFYHVSGSGFDKVICEACLTLIFAISKKKKEENGC